MSRSEFSVAGVSALEPAESLLKECDVFRAAGDEANPLAELAYQAEDRVGNLVKMKGDYHRYLVEFKTGAERKDATGSTLLAYKANQAVGSHGKQQPSFHHGHGAATDVDTSAACSLSSSSYLLFPKFCTIQTVPLSTLCSTHGYAQLFQRSLIQEEPFKSTKGAVNCSEDFYSRGPADMLTESIP